jgi:hypothetical protein
MSTTTDILDICLAEMAAGTGTDDCLERYAEQAGELAPLLAAAAELRGLHEFKMPGEQWTRVQATLAATAKTRKGSGSIAVGQAEGEEPRAPGLLGLLGALRRSVNSAGRSAALALVILLLLSATVTATSQPGDLAYSWRLAAERIPVYLAITPLSRGTAELRNADRRLTDVRTHLIATGHADPVALNALLGSDSDAASLAGGLPAGEREQIATSIARHAFCLQELSRTALGEKAAAVLGQAASQTLQVAKRARGAAPAPGEAGSAPATGPYVAP